MNYATIDNDELLLGKVLIRQARFFADFKLLLQIQTDRGR